MGYLRSCFYLRLDEIAIKPEIGAVSPLLIRLTPALLVIASLSKWFEGMELTTDLCVSDNLVAPV